MRVWSYLTNPEIVVNTQSCRVKVWAHDNAFTIVLVSLLNVVGWIFTVVTCS